MRAALDAMADAGPMPALAVFDLDYTLWPLWVDTHVDTPLRRSPPDAINRVTDPSGYVLSFYPHVPTILLWLKERGIKVAAASRTCAPNAAKQALRGLTLVDTRAGNEGKQVAAITLFDQLEIYPGSKITHMRKIAAGMGHEFEEFIFFDDEHRNAEVERQLGVLFVDVPDGVTLESFKRGISAWRRRQGSL